MTIQHLCFRFGVGCRPIPSKEEHVFEIVHPHAFRANFLDIPKAIQPHIVITSIQVGLRNQILCSIKGVWCDLFPVEADTSQAHEPWRIHVQNNSSTPVEFFAKLYGFQVSEKSNCKCGCQGGKSYPWLKYLGTDFIDTDGSGRKFP